MKYINREVLLQLGITLGENGYFPYKKCGAVSLKRRCHYMLWRFPFSFNQSNRSFRLAVARAILVSAAP
jgi:hypothetical protein